MKTRLWLFALAAASGCASPSSSTAPTRVAVAGESPIAEVFTRVSRDTGVPADLLAAVSWTETRFAFVTPTAESHAFQWGPLGLTDTGSGPRDLHTGAALAGVSDDAARTDLESSIRAGAAILRSYAAAHDHDFHAALRDFGGDSFARSVEHSLARGIDGRDDAGRSITVAARFDTATSVNDGLSSVSQAVGYNGAEWIPAYSGNYQTASRGLTDVKYIIIHDTEGSYNATVSWFQDPAANVSAHYLVRSSDGHVAQMVDEKDIAWHVKCFNSNAVGIEHEGYAASPTQWYTEAMYVESAKVTAYLADKYNIAKEHNTSAIMAHGEAPDCSDHTDPGPGWDWTHYMDLVRTGGASSFNAADLTIDAPDVLHTGEVGTVKVTVNNTGSAAWDLDATRIGTQDPADRSSDLYVEGDWISPSRATAVDAQTPAGTSGTFTFQVRGPAVSEPTVYDETFSFVQEDSGWFGPTFHLVLQVRPAGDDGGSGDGSSGGCNASGSGPGGLGLAFGVLALVTTRRRRRRRA